MKHSTPPIDSNNPVTNVNDIVLTVEPSENLGLISNASNLSIFPQSPRLLENTQGSLTVEHVDRPISIKGRSPKKNKSTCCPESTLHCGLKIATESAYLVLAIEDLLKQSAEAESDPDTRPEEKISVHEWTYLGMDFFMLTIFVLLLAKNMAKNYDSDIENGIESGRENSSVTADETVDKFCPYFLAGGLSLALLGGLITMAVYTTQNHNVLYGAFLITTLLGAGTAIAEKKIMDHHEQQTEEHKNKKEKVAQKNIYLKRRNSQILKHYHTEKSKTKKSKKLGRHTLLINRHKVLQKKQNSLKKTIEHLTQEKNTVAQQSQQAQNQLEERIKDMQIQLDQQISQNQLLSRQVEELKLKQEKSLGSPRGLPTSHLGFIQAMHKQTSKPTPKINNAEENLQANIEPIALPELQL